MLAGIAQIVLGAVGAADSARFVPYPFVAGFMCGISALVIITELPALGGFTRADLAAGPASAWHALQPATLFVGVATAAVIWAIGKRVKLTPAPLLGLIAGTILYYAIKFALPAASLGPVIGAEPHWLPVPTALLPLADLPWAPIVPHLDVIVTTAG